VYHAKAEDNFFYTDLILDIKLLSIKNESTLIFFVREIVDKQMIIYFAFFEYLLKVME